MEQNNILQHSYDACIKRIYKDSDIPFYLSYAKPNNNILEITCGTGRLMIPLVNIGANVTGLDLSRTILQVLQTKRKFELIQNDKVVATRTEYLELDYLYKEQAGNLFIRAGFIIKDLFADYDKTPIDNNKKKDLTYVLQKK